MYGANQYGATYYGQSTGQVFILNTRTLTASVTTVAKLTKLVNIKRLASVTTVASVLAPYQKALSRLASSITRALFESKTTRRIF